MKKMIPLGAVLFGMALMAILMMTSVKCSANPNANHPFRRGRLAPLLRRKDGFVCFDE